MPSVPTKAVSGTDSRGLCVLHVLPCFRPAYGFGGPAFGTDMMTSGLGEEGCLVTVWTSNVLDPSGVRLKSGREATNSLVVQRYRYVSRPLFRVAGALVTPGMVLDAIGGDREISINHPHALRPLPTSWAFAC